jgi:hypothetical protein
MGDSNERGERETEDENEMKIGRPLLKNRSIVRKSLNLDPEISKKEMKLMSNPKNY